MTKNTEINKDVVPSFEEFLYNEQGLLTMICEHYADNNADDFKSETLEDAYHNIIDFVHGVRQPLMPVHEFLSEIIEHLDDKIMNLNNDVYETERIDRDKLLRLAERLSYLSSSIVEYLAETAE